MNKIYFKTSKFNRVVFPLLVIFNSVYIILMAINGYFNALSLVVIILLPLLFCFSLRKYVLSDTLFYIKNSIGFRYYVIPWSAMNRIYFQKKDIRINYTKPNGKMGYIVLRDVEDKQKLYYSLQQYMAHCRA